MPGSVPVRAHIGIPKYVHRMHEKDHLDLEHRVMIEDNRHHQEEPLAPHHDWPVVDSPAVSSQVDVGV